MELLSKAEDGAAVTCSVPECTQPLQSGLAVKKLPLTYVRLLPSPLCFLVLAKPSEGL